MSEVLDEGIMVRTFLVFLGVSMIIMGIMALTISLSAQTLEESKGGSFVVIIGPFFLAMGKDIPLYITVVLIAVSLILILLLVLYSRRFLKVVGSGTS